MTRDALQSMEWWNQWVLYEEQTIGKFTQSLSGPVKNPQYRPQSLREIANHWLAIVLRRYSRGDSPTGLAAAFSSLLELSEKSEAAGRAVWTPEQQRIRHSWAVNLDFYVDCFWLVGLAMTLKIPEPHWLRLLALIGNDGEDMLLDRIIATRLPSRRIGSTLCYPKPYARLHEAIDAPRVRQAALLNTFVESWYKELAEAAKSGREPQAVPIKAPYWHNFHRIDGAYFGFWCIEAAAAVKAFRMDDSLCIGHPSYPGDLLRHQEVTAPDRTRLAPEFAAMIGVAPQAPLIGETQSITAWKAFTRLVKSKLGG